MKLNLIQFLSNAAIVGSGIFIPVFAHSLGASYIEIGLISAFSSGATFISSFICAKIVDKYRIRPIILVGLLISSIAFLLQIFAYDPTSLIIVRAITGCTIGIYPAALIVSVYYEKESIGKFSSFGALGWVLGYIIAGITSNIQYLFLLSSAMFFLCFIISLKISDIEKPKSQVSYFSLNIFRVNLDVYLSTFLRHMGAVSVWVTLPLYLANLGASHFWIAIIYAINPAIQFLIMRRLDSFKNFWLIKWGIFLSAVAFIEYYVAPNYFYIIFGMILVAFSWAFLFVGANQIVVERSVEKASSIGVLNSSISAAEITGAIIGGLIIQFYGYKETMIFAIFCSFIAMGIFIVMNFFPQKKAD